MQTFLSDPAKIAVAGDWHANTRWAANAVDRAGAEGATRILHTGDFGYLFTDGYLDWLEDALTEWGIHLGFVDGNHEDHDWLAHQPVAEDGLRHLRPHIAHLPRGFRWAWYGVTFLALGGAHSVDRQARIPGSSWWPEERVSLSQARAAAGDGRVDVVIAHDVPAGPAIPGLARPGTFPPEEIAAADEHRELLRLVADQVRPLTWWHGHYHVRHDTVLNGPGYQTVVHGLGRDGDLAGNLVLASDVLSLTR